MNLFRCLYMLVISVSLLTACTSANEAPSIQQDCFNDRHAGLAASQQDAGSIVSSMIGPINNQTV